ncbi:MAG: retroviral-like aspartic protease family protein, partial [Candidatus Methanospirareceae archaeon]
MGHIFVKVYLKGRKKGEEVKMLVDTGAIFTVIPKDLAERLDIPKLRKEKVKLANGMEKEAEAGIVHVKINEREAPATVLIMD